MEVAVKTLPSRSSDDLTQRFLKEVAIMRAVDPNDNIIKYEHPHC